MFVVELHFTSFEVCLLDLLECSCDLVRVAEENLRKTALDVVDFESVEGGVDRFCPVVGNSSSGMGQPDLSKFPLARVVLDVRVNEGGEVVLEFWVPPQVIAHTGDLEVRCS